MSRTQSERRPGYLYVLVHPAHVELFKVGVTVRAPEERLAQHNSDYSQLAGQIVEETGQLWELKEFHPVPDPYYAESVFWANTRFADIPYRRGVEIEHMTWPEVQKALDGAKCAGQRPPGAEQPAHVYAYTAQIRRRLSGRGIALCGYVRSIVSGRADFRCTNGHQWRTTPRLVGEGSGCPECGVGERSHEDIRRTIKAGVVCLLTHPDKLEHVNVGVACGTLEEVSGNWPWGTWEMHRYRRVDDIDMAERIAWDLLDKPLPHDRQPIEKKLDIAEGAFRGLVYAIQEEFANEERRRERFEDLPEL